MGNRLKKLIMFLVVVLGMTLFANEEQKAPNEIIKDNPDREVTTVESMKVRDHATMSLSVTKKSVKEVEGILRGKTLRVNLPTEEKIEDSDNRMAKTTKQKRLVVGSKKENRAVMFRSATPVKKFPTQEEMNNLTPEKIRALLAENKKDESNNETNNSIIIDKKEYKIANHNEGKTSIDIFDVNKDEEIYLNIEENGKVVDTYLAKTVDKNNSDLKLGEKKISGFASEKVYGKDATFIEFLSGNKGVGTGNTTQSSNVKSIDLKGLDGIQTRNFTFNDEYFPSIPRTFEVYTKDYAEEIGFGFKVAHNYDPLDAIRIFIVPENGTETMKKKNNTSSGYMISDLITDGQTGLDYITMAREGFIAKNKTTREEYKFFKKLVVKETTYYQNFPHSDTITGAITEARFRVATAVKDSIIYPGPYGYSGEFVSAEYKTDKGATHINAKVSDIKIDISQSSRKDGYSLGANGAKLLESEIGNETLNFDTTHSSTQEYLIETKNSDNNLSFMTKQNSSDLGIYLYTNKQTTPLKLTQGAEQEVTYDQALVDNSVVTHTFKVKVTQADNEWAKVYIIPSGIENPINENQKPKVEFELVQGRKVGNGLVEYRRVKYTVNTERITTPSSGTIYTEIDPRFYEQKFKNTDKFLDLRGILLNGLNGDNEDYSKFVGLNLNSNDNLKINDVVKVDGEGLSTTVQTGSSNKGYNKFFGGTGVEIAIRKPFTVSQMKTQNTFAFMPAVLLSKWMQPIRVYFEQNGTERSLRNEIKIIDKQLYDQNFSNRNGYTGRGMENGKTGIDFGSKQQGVEYKLVTAATGGTNEIITNISGNRPNLKGMVYGKTEKIIGTHYKVIIDGVVQNSGTNNGYIPIGTKTTFLNDNANGKRGIEVKLSNNSSNEILTIKKLDNKDYPSKDIRLDYYYKNGNIEVKLGEFTFEYSNVNLELPSVGSLTTEIDSRLLQLYKKDSAKYNMVTLGGNFGYVTPPNVDWDPSVNFNNFGYSKFISTNGTLKSTPIMQSRDYYVHLYNLSSESPNGQELGLRNWHSNVYYRTYIGSYGLDGNEAYNRMFQLQNSKLSNITEIKTGNNFIRRIGTLEGRDLFTKITVRFSTPYTDTSGGSLDYKRVPFTHELRKVSGGANFSEEHGYFGNGTVDLSGKAINQVVRVAKGDVENIGADQVRVLGQTGELPTFASLVGSKENVARSFTATKGSRNNGRGPFYGIDNGNEVTFGNFKIRMGLNMADEDNKEYIKIIKLNDKTSTEQNIYIEYYTEPDSNNNRVKLGEFVLTIKNEETAKDYRKMTTKVDPRIAQIVKNSSIDTDEEISRKFAYKWISLEGKVGTALTNHNDFYDASNFVYTDRSGLDNKTIKGAEGIEVFKGNTQYVKNTSNPSGYLKYGTNNTTDYIAIKTENINLNTPNNNADIAKNIKFVRKTGDLGEYTIKFTAGDNTKGMFKHELQLIDNERDFTPENGYSGTGSIDFTGVTEGQYNLVKPSGTNTGSDRRLTTLSGSMPNLQSLVRSNKRIAEKYIISVADENGSFNEVGRASFGSSNHGVDILDGKYNVTLTNDIVARNVRVNKKSDDTIPLTRVKIEYFTTVSTGNSTKKDIKLGEFILSISNRETITEMGRLLTEVDPRLAQFYNDFDEQWIGTDSVIEDTPGSETNSGDISDFIYNANEITGNMSISDILEIKKGDTKYTNITNSGSYKIYNSVYGVKIGGSISGTTVGDTFIRKYKDDGELILKLKGTNNAKYRLYHITNNFKNMLNIYFTADKGYIGSGCVDLSNEEVGKTYTLITYGEVASGDSVNIADQKGYLPIFKRIVSKDKKNSNINNENIADTFSITIDGQVIPNPQFDQKISIGTGNLKLSLSNTGIISIEKVNDETISDKRIEIKYYNNYSVNGKKLQLGEYTLTVRNNGSAVANGSIITKVDPRVKQLGINYTNYWISTGGYVASSLNNFNDSLAPKYSGIIDTTLTNISSSTISKVISIAKSNGVIYQKVSNNSIVNSYTKYENDSSDPYKDVFGIRIGNNISKAKDNHGTIARKYKDNTNGILTIKYLEGMGDKTTKKSFTHTLTIENGPSSNFTADAGYSGSGTVDLSNKRVGKYKIVKPISTKNTAPTDLPLESLNGVLPNINSLATKAPIATHYSVDNGVNYTALGTETEVEVGKLKITLDTDGNIILNKLKDDKVTEDSVTIDYFYFSDKDDTNSTKIKLGSFTLNISDSMFELDTANQALDFGTMFYDSRDGKVNHIKRTQKFTLKAHDKEVNFRVTDTSEMTTADKNNKIDLIDVKVTKKTNTSFELGATAVLDKTTASGTYNGEIQVIVDIITPSNP